MAKKWESERRWFLVYSMPIMEVKNEQDEEGPYNFQILRHEIKIFAIIQRSLFSAYKMIEKLKLCFLLNQIWSKPILFYFSQILKKAQNQFYLIFPHIFLTW